MGLLLFFPFELVLLFLLRNLNPFQFSVGNLWVHRGDLAVVMHQTHSPGPGRQQQRRRRRRRRSQSRGLAFPRLDNDAPKNSRAIRHYPVPSIGRTGALYMGKKHGAMKNGQQIIDHMSPTDAAERHGSLFPRARPFAARNQWYDPST